jgi:hypothetical protein
MLRLFSVGWVCVLRVRNPGCRSLSLSLSLFLSLIPTLVKIDLFHFTSLRFTLYSISFISLTHSLIHSFTHSLSFYYKYNNILLPEGGICCKKSVGLNQEYHILGKFVVASIENRDHSDYHDALDMHNNNNDKTSPPPSDTTNTLRP